MVNTWPKRLKPSAIWLAVPNSSSSGIRGGRLLKVVMLAGAGGRHLSHYEKLSPGFVPALSPGACCPLVVDLDLTGSVRMD